MHDAGNGRFRTCSLCGFEWKTREDFLADPSLNLIGYQAHFDDLKAGLFLFNHTCKTTLSLSASAFLDLYDGPMFERPLTGTETCPSYCLRQEELERCPAQCECAYVREVIQVIRNWSKDGRPKKNADETGQVSHRSESE